MLEGGLPADGGFIPGGAFGEADHGDAVPDGPAHGGPGGGAGPTGDDDDGGAGTVENLREAARNLAGGNAGAGPLPDEGFAPEGAGFARGVPGVGGAPAGDLDGEEVADARGGAQTREVVGPEIIEDEGDGVHGNT